MGNAAKIVNGAVIGMDYRVVLVNGKRYVIQPLSIHKIAGIGFYLSDVIEGESVKDLIKSMKDITKVTDALSWAIKGNTSLSSELAKGTFDELIEALSEAVSLISAENFIKLSILAKNVAKLTAKQK